MSNGRRGPPVAPGLTRRTDLPYARAFLPSLAAIMMSALVRSGDRIDLPMPHPKAWVETAAYVYTGEEELLTATVKLNVEHLGGKV